MMVMLAASFLYSLGNLFVVLVQDRYSVAQIILFRNLAALLFLTPIFFKNPKYFRTNHIKLHIIRNVWAYINVALFYLTLRHLGLVDATILNSTYAFFIPFISFIWLKESMPAHIWWSIGFGFLGITLILQPNWNLSPLGSLIALCSSITAAFSFASVRSLNLKNEPPLRSYFYFYVIGFVFVFPFSI